MVLARDAIGVEPRAPIEQRDPRAVAGRVADRHDALQVAIRDEAEHHGVLRVDVAAERTGQDDPVHRRHAPLLHEQLDAGVQRGLAQLDGADVGLGDRDRLPGGRVRGVRQDVDGRAAVVLDARRARRSRLAEQAVGGEHASQKELGDGLDDAAAADAGRGRGFVAGGNPVGMADDLPARLERRRVDAHALDRAGRGALAVRDLRAFEGRPGRARAAQHPAPVAQDDLGIGADVDDQHELVAGVRGLGQLHGDVVGADVAGDAGQHVHTRRRVQAQTQLARLEVDRLAHRQRERRAAELHGADPEQQVVHDGVADEHDIDDVVERDPGRLDRALGQLLQRGDDGPVHLLRAVRVHHHVADPAHQVLAEAHLRVHRRLGRFDHTGAQIAQMHDHGGRPDVDGQAVRALGIAGLHAQHLAVLPERDGQRLFAGREHRLELGQRGRVDRQAAQLPLGQQRRLQPLPVAAMRVERRGRDFDVDLAHRRLDVDGALGGRLGHDLLARLAFLGDHDQQIALHLAGAGQAPARRQLVLIQVLGLAPIRRREVLGRRGQGVLGEVPGLDRNLALPARLPPGADRLDLHTQLAGRFEQVRAALNATPPARWHQRDCAVVPR